MGGMLRRERKDSNSTVNDSCTKDNVSSNTVEGKSIADDKNTEENISLNANELSFFENAESSNLLMKILEYLSVKDILNFSCVSMKLKDIVHQFVKHEIENLSNIIEQSRKRIFYLDYELELKENFSQLSPTLQYALLKKWSRLHRWSIYHCYCANAHLPLYFERFYDDHFKRTIVYLKHNWWLDINGTTEDVTPGEYEYKLRLNLDKYLEHPSKPWADNLGKVMYVKWVDRNGPQEHSVKIHMDKFNGIVKLLEPNMKKETIVKNCWVCNYDENTGYFDLVLGGINIADTCSVKCALYGDHTTLLCDIGFDFIELTPKNY